MAMTMKNFLQAISRNKVHYGVHTGMWHRPNACGAKSKYKNTYSILYDKVNCLNCLRKQATSGSRRAKQRMREIKEQF